MYSFASSKYINKGNNNEKGPLRNFEQTVKSV